MDTDNTPSMRPTAAPGGAVEPANRATVAKEKFQTPLEVEGPRFEMRDPFAEVTYRANSFKEMIAKADQLGSTRFIAVDADGKRSTVQKVDGEWPKAPFKDVLKEALKEAEISAPTAAKKSAPQRDDGTQTTNVVPLSKSPSPAVPADTKVLANIEGKAERAAQITRLETELAERYLIKRAPLSAGDVSVGRTEYRFRGDTTRVAFTASTFRLATDTNSPSVARSMVDLAEARGWRALRVSGNEDFKRMVWLEASVRNVKTLGYEPNPADLDVLQKAREARLTNRIEPDRKASRSETAAANKPTPLAPEKASTRGGGGRKAVLVAIEAVLVAKGVPDKQRAAVMAAATEQLAQRQRDGQSFKVKVFDKAAPSQRPVVVPIPDVQRSRERAAQVR
jgi:Large polyvalent protein-associated domain 7